MKIVSNIAELGAEIRTTRGRLGVTQEQLAAAAGVNPRFVSEVERGKQTAEVAKVFQLLHAVGLQVGVGEA